MTPSRVSQRVENVVRFQNVMWAKYSNRNEGNRRVVRFLCDIFRMIQGSEVIVIIGFIFDANLGGLCRDFPYQVVANPSRLVTVSKRQICIRRAPCGIGLTCEGIPLTRYGRQSFSIWHDRLVSCHHRE